MSDDPDARICGLILAGGRATRLGGRDKAQIMLGGQSLIARTILRARPQVSRLALNANGPAQRFAEHGLAVLADTIGDHWGPLAGILAGLEHFADSGWLASFPTDSPFFPEDLVQRLAARRLATGARIAMAASPSGLQPVFALWPVGLAAELRQALTAGLRKTETFARRYAVATVEWPDDRFFNINRPEDLTAATRLL